MKYLDYGIRFIFTNDYIVGARNCPKGTKCNTLNGVVAINEQGQYLFDIDSNLARKFGEIINEGVNK